MGLHCDSAGKLRQRPISKKKKKKKKERKKERKYSASSFTMAVDLGFPDNIEDIGKVS